MSELEQKIVDLADKYGQPAIDATLSAARTEAASYLATVPIKLGVAAAAAYGAYYLYKHLRKMSDFEDQLLPGLGIGLCGIVAFVAGLLGIWSLIDPWVWVALFNPEVYIAKRLLP